MRAYESQWSKHPHYPAKDTKVILVTNKS